MIPTNARRGIHQAAPAYGVGQPYHPAPNAALLIDFDNVTLGIQKDLGKELKTLLNSDVIRGKVAVQRAYADWRRYPQYIVPLAESSIDLIFAPAYGPGKKNATDLRMAIDAMELVFTRPEIGTFILLTGDSDFSSCVLKLKEYGKYVIGVGMRESSSDLLIQNCDEYYSYHALSGLTRATESTGSTEDPWVLVRRAAEQMVKAGDVMRTDRLKQVMIDLDPGFDEKQIGYSKFSKFVSEAVTRGIIRVRRGENGQQEIVYTPDGSAAAAQDEEETPRASAEPREGREPRDRDRGRTRDRHGRRRGGRGDGAREEPRAPRAEADAETDGRPAPEPIRAEQETPEPAAAAAEPEAAEAPRAAAAPPAEAPSDLEGAYGVLQEALRAMGAPGAAVRDGDLKRKMLEIAPDFDESKLGFSKFTRFLRQAHDAEVVDLNRQREGVYEVKLGSRKLAMPLRRPAAPRDAAPSRGAEPAAEPKAGPSREERATAAVPAAPATPVGSIRGRRGGRGAPAGPPPLLPGQVVGRATPAPADTSAETPAAVEPAAPQTGSEAPALPSTSMGSGGINAEPEVVREAAEASAEPRGGRTRRGRGRGRGKAADDTPPPLLPGQVATVPAAAGEVAAPEPVEVAAEVEAAAPESQDAVKKRRRGRGGRKRAETPAAEAPADAAALADAVEAAEAELPAAEPAAEEAAPAAAKKRRGRGGRKRVADAGADAAPAPTAAPSFSAERLGLPGDPAEIAGYISSAFKGVGKKTAEPLVEAFGADVFRVMQEEPARVRELLGERRAATVLDQWVADFERRAGAGGGDTIGAETTTDAASEPEVEAGPAKEARRGRSRRGGRGRPAKRKEPPSA